MRSRFFKTEGIVLNSVRFGEGHKIIRLFTENLGKIDASAFGARKTKSRFGSRLEPFTIGSFLLYQKSEENPYSIKEVEVSSHNASIREDLNKYLIGNALIEPVIRFVENAQVDRDLYHLLSSAFILLDRVSSKKSIFLLSMYDLRFLSIMGYKPDTKTCARCGLSVGRDEFYCDSLHGFPVCRGCSSASAQKVLEGTQRFINWSLDYALAGAERVSMNETTRNNLRTVIETMYMSNFGKKLSSWDQLNRIFDFS